MTSTESDTARRTRRTGSPENCLPSWYDEHHARQFATDFLSRPEIEATIRRYLHVKRGSAPLSHIPANELTREQWQSLWDADDELNSLYQRLDRACALLYLPDGDRPAHLDHLAQAYRSGEIRPGPGQPVATPGDLVVEHHNSLGASSKPLRRIREGERVEATVTIAAVRRFGGHVRLLLESHDGESAHARVSVSRFAAAEEALGRTLKVGDQVLVRGYVEQEPALRAGIKSIDIGSIRAEA
ncbi:OB-fold nucleic acid binding domain-containing protein [Streptomyces chartreusis]